jgi:predicted transcriptional regulator
LKKDAKLTLKLPKALKKRLKGVAKEKERTMSWLANKYVEQGVERDEGRRSR